MLLAWLSPFFHYLWNKFFGIFVEITKSNHYFMLCTQIFVNEYIFLTLESPPGKKLSHQKMKKSGQMPSHSFYRAHKSPPIRFYGADKYGTYNLTNSKHM